MDTLIQDLRYAFRQLARSPGFALVAILTLALGIGANTAIFSVVSAVLLRPLPYPESDRLVTIQSTGMGGRARFGLSYPDYTDINRLTDVVSAVGLSTTSAYNLSGVGEPRETRAALVTPTLFGVLGVPPLKGRAFGEADEREPVALISHAFWLNAFGGDPSAIGRGVTLDGRSYTVIGVMPASFRYPDEEVEVWIPMGWAFVNNPAQATMRGYHAFSGIARLAPGADVARLRTALDLLSSQINAAEQSQNRGEVRIEVQGGPGRGGMPGGAPGGARVGGGGPGGGMAGNGFRTTTLREEVVGDTEQALWVLAGAVGLVLLIACANAANLLIARSSGRRKEIAVRQALGAARGRLVRQLLTESVLLATAGGALGVVLALGGLNVILATWPGVLPRVDEISVNGPVLVFTVALSVATGIAFGLIPAYRASAPGLEEALREESGAGAGRRRRRTQATLVVAEIALALVLFVGAGLLMRSFVALNAVDPGFDVRDVMAARIRLTPSRYQNPRARQEFFDRLVDLLRQRGGAGSVTVARTLPLSGARQMLAIDPRQVRRDDPEQFLGMGMTVVGPDFFSTLKIPILEGRGFTPEDRMGAPPVTVINIRLARRLWPDGDAIGKTLPVDGPPGQRDVAATVVGIIGDIHGGSLADDVGPELFLPLAQLGFGEQLWVAMRGPRPLGFAEALRDGVRVIDPEQPVAEIASLPQMITRQQAARRLNTTLLGVFAGLAVLLAMIGIAGVTAYAVSQRTREFGLRMALGAARGDVVRLVVGENVALVAAGVVLGLVGAAVSSRLLASLLFGVRALDVATFGVTALLLAAVALGATLVPARRAARVDPVVALRAE